MPATPLPAPTERAATVTLKETPCRASSALSICYDLSVPENHGAPNGRTIQLHVAVFRSTAKDRVGDPILFLMGGPGAPGIESFSWSRGGFPQFNGRHDVIVLDQRGTGSSIPKLTCPEFVAAVQEVQQKMLSDEGSTKVIAAAMRACHERLTDRGIDLAAYTNAEIAADVEDLRRALGIAKWNLFGWSYGARVALTVMRDYPNGVRSAVRDSVYPPQANQLSEFAANTQATFDALFARCRADAKCDQAYPDVERAFYQLLTDLDARWIAPTRCASTRQRLQRRRARA
jgi:pimeloyl-ACP methyl ester carboxylesterase